MLPKRVRNVTPWFKASEEILHAAIHRRNVAFNLVHSVPSVDTRSKYVTACKIAHQMVRNAKSCWIKDKCDAINVGFISGTGVKDAWDFVKILKVGLAPTRRPHPTKMRREDGALTVNSIEGAEVFADHFNHFYGRIPTFDSSVLDLLPQEIYCSGNDGVPSDDEIARSISRLHATSPGAYSTHARL